jgi:heme exporter protein D
MATWVWIVLCAVALAVLAGVVAMSVMRRENWLKDEVANQAARRAEQRLRKELDAQAAELQELRSLLLQAPPRESEHAFAHASLLRPAEDRAKALQARLDELEKRQEEALTRQEETTAKQVEELRDRHERVARAVADLPPDEEGWDVRHFRA